MENPDEDVVGAGAEVLAALVNADRPWTAAEGLAVVEAWRSSGLRRVDFCQKHGLKFHKLAWWASKKGREKRDGPPKASGFREVKVVTRAQPGRGAVPAAGTGRMEVALSNGCRVQVGPDFDGAALERLFSVLVRAC